jgi:hypothetical protein
MKFCASENQKVENFVSPGCFTPDFGYNKPRRVYVKGSQMINYYHLFGSL